MRSTLAVCLLLLLMIPSVSFAQFTNPITDLDYGVTPECPLDCDDVTIWISGVLPNFCWSMPRLMNWVRDGDHFTLYISTDFDPTIECVQVLMPFRVELPVGDLPDGAYEVSYVIVLGNTIATMPGIPILVDDVFRVAPPGDLNCNGLANMQDVIRLIDFTFRGASMNELERRADVGCDGRINVIDVVGLIGHVLWKQSICHPCKAVGSLPKVRIADIDPATFQHDYFDLDTVRVTAETLEVSLYRSGGCKEHSYAVYMTPSAFMESMPVQASLYVVHDDPGDPCDAWIHETLRFDLRPVAELYEQSYGSAGEILLHIHDYSLLSAMGVSYTTE